MNVDETVSQYSDEMHQRTKGFGLWVEIRIDICSDMSDIFKFAQLHGRTFCSNRLERSGRLIAEPFARFAEAALSFHDTGSLGLVGRTHLKFKARRPCRPYSIIQVEVVISCRKYDCWPGWGESVILHFSGGKFLKPRE